MPILILIIIPILILILIPILILGDEPSLSENSYPPKWENNDVNSLIALRDRLSGLGNDNSDDDDDDDDPYSMEIQKSKVLSFTMCEIRDESR